MQDFMRKMSANCGIIEEKECCKMSKSNKFNNGEQVSISDTGEKVTILNWKYVINMKRYSYTVKEYPATFYFEEELKKA